MIPGPLQMLLVVFIIILLFGAKRLPALMRSVGQSVTAFKKRVSDTTDADTGESDTPADTH